MKSTQTTPPKQPMSSWFLLGAIILIVGGLLTVWVVRYDDTLAADRAEGQPDNLPLGDIKGGFSYLSEVWEEKTSQLVDLFSPDAAQTEEGDEQNQGQVGQLTNAGLTNQQIDSIEQDLFENVAPQE